ncbi:MAG: alanine--tRNA ligase, partial [Myxococcales bacterium]|nr:alanine--tRNA ligase [Myxococcales bacterium]
MMPSNEGRGYVLRRIMRRAIRHGRRLGFEDLFFHDVCGHVVETHREAYPDLTRARSLIEKVAESEEASFRRTLDRGLRLLADKLEVDQKPVSLDPAFVADLYDTYGFPIDLTRVIAEEHGLTLDEKAVEAKVKELQSNEQSFSSGEAAVGDIYFQLANRFGATEFLGYAGTSGEGKLLAIVQGGALVERAGIGDEVELVFDRTSFYGESGGQLGDVGTIVFSDSSQGPASDARIEVADTIKPTGGLHVHKGRITRGAIR